MAKSPEVRLVELAYELERGPGEWMAMMGRALHEIVPGVVSTFVMEFTRLDGRIAVGELWTEEPALHRQLRGSFDSMTEDQRALFGSAPLTVGTAREILAGAGIPVESTPVPLLYQAMHGAELFAVAALDPSGQGLTFGVSLATPESPPAEVRITLSQIGAHVAAGARLRRRLHGEQALDHADAVLQPDGTIDSVGSLCSDASELLTRAVERVEHARADGRSPREALDLWQGLVAGRWSLVDRFEGAGRRYYVAVRNPPQVCKNRALTARETETLAYVVAGASTKDTAYALGIDVKTVNAHIRSAMTKLGVDSRAELIALRTMLFEAEN